MCGLVGVAGNIWKQEKEAFRILLWHDYVRGPHSTGVGTVTRQNVKGYMKNVGSPEKLWESFEGKGMKDGIIEDTVKALIGHNRWATVGAKSGKNAHPFMHGDILGAHNGTLKAFHLSNFPKHKEFEVDSECIFESLNSDGFVKTMDRLSGAYALVWYDSKTEHMNFIRNKERPLFGVWNKLGDAFYWASEKWMLEASLGRCGVDYQEIFAFETDKLYQLNIKNTGKMVGENLEVVAEHTGFEVPVYKSPFQQTTKWQPQGTNTGGSTSQATQTSIINRGGTDDGAWAKGKIYDTKKCKWVFETPAVSNVIILPPPAAKAKPLDYKTYKSYSGKDIDFHIVGKETSKNSNTPYFSAQLVGDDNEFSDEIDVRVYGVGHEDGQKWQTWDGYFNGKVKKAVNHKGEMYLLIDLRTITYLEWAIEEEVGKPESFRWFNGIKIDEDQWIQRTNCGCANCSTTPQPVEQDYCVWITADAFLCAECGTNQTVLKAIMQQVG